MENNAPGTGEGVVTPVVQPDTPKKKSEIIARRMRELPGRLKESVRHENVWGFLVSMAVILVVSIVFFYPDNIDGNVLSPHDTIQGAANGEEARAYEEATGEKALWTNSLFSGMPTFQIAPEYPSNDLFTWLNDVYGLGLPVPSNLLFMMMFGFLIMLTCLKLRWWYALIGALAWGLSSYFIIIIGAGHIWKFVALSYVPPTIGGFIMIYRGRRLAGAAMLALFMMLELNANHPQITYYFGFLMAFLAVGFLIRAIVAKRLKQWGLATAVVAGAIALALGANLPSIYNTYEYSKETKRAASELTPLKADGSDATAERPTGGLPKSEIGGWSNLPEESLSLLIPNIKGGASIKPEKGSFRHLTINNNEHFNNEMYRSEPVVTDPLGRQMPFPVYYQLTEYFGGKGMTNGPFYVGIVIFALFLLGCFIVRGPVKWVLLIATVFSVLLAMGNHFEALTDFMIYNVPLYNKFRAAETALVIACLCIPLLGILALHKLFTTPNPLKNRSILRGLSVALIFPLFICFFVYVSPETFGTALTDEEISTFEQMPQQLTAMGYSFNPEEFEATLANVQEVRYAIVSADAMRSMWILILGAVVIYLTLRGRINHAVACVALGIIVTVDLYTVDKRYIDHESFASGLTADTGIKPDQIDRAILADKDYYRVADLASFGDARRSYFHHMIGGYHAAKLNRYNDLIERGEIANPQVLNMLNARYIIRPEQDTQTGQEYLTYGLNDQAWGPAWLASHIDYVNTPDEEFAALETLAGPDSIVADNKFREVLGEAETALAEGDFIRLDKYTPNCLTYTVDTRNGGVAVFSEVWFPWGWTATVDGKEVPLGRVNYILRALRVPAGKHTVVMTFDPASLHTTGAIAYVAVTLIYLLVLGALFGACVRREDKEKEVSKSNV